MRLTAIHKTSSRAGVRRGLTMIEVAVSTMLVGTLILASLQTVGQVFRFRNETSNQQQGLGLAQQLVARIEQYPYQDPDGGGTFGREYFEVVLNQPRDDFDDFHGFTESPPQDATGTTLVGFEDWSWRASIQRKDPVTLQDTYSDFGAAVLTVTVSRNGVDVAEMQSLRIDVDLMEVE